jgi:hypothetical protein
MDRCLSLISSHFSSIILISSVSCIPTDLLIRVAVVLDQHQDEASLLQRFPATSILLLPQGALQVFDQTVKFFSYAFIFVLILFHALGLELQTTKVVVLIPS